MKNKRRKKTWTMKDYQTRITPIAALFNADIIFLLSEMLPGEYALSTLPLICKTTASARLSLNLCDSSSSSPYLPSSSCSSSSLFRPKSSPSSSFSYLFQWTREAFLYSIPSRHSIHSIQLDGKNVEAVDGNISWLASRAPKLECLTISDTDDFKMVDTIKEGCLNNDLLKSLNIPFFFPRDADSLSILPNLTKLTVHTVYCSESVLLKAVWPTPLLSLRIGFQRLAIKAEGEEERKSEQRATPPRFATTLRELEYCEENTSDTLSLYCRQLERLYCMTPRGLVYVNPNLMELHISRCDETVIALNCLLALEILCVDFEGAGTVHGTCPNLRHTDLYKPRSIIALLSSSRALESVRLRGCGSSEREAYMKYFTSSHFPKTQCTVYWDGLRKDDMQTLLEAGVQLHETCVGGMGRFTIPPWSYLTRCTEFDFQWYPVDPNLITSMASLTTVQLGLKTVEELSLLLTLVPSLTEVDTCIYCECCQLLYLRSHNLRFLKIRFPDSAVASSNCYDINLPSLCSLSIDGLESELFAGTFLSDLFSGSDSVCLPSLRSLLIRTNEPEEEEGPWNNGCKCSVGHPHLRELVLMNIKWRSFHLEKVPNMRRLKLEYLPKAELWLDLPARCLVKLGDSVIKPSLALSSPSPRLDLPPLSSLMLRVWAQPPPSSELLLCPICRKNSTCQQPKDGEEPRTTPSTSTSQRCAHALDFILDDDGDTVAVMGVDVVI